MAESRLDSGMSPIAIWSLIAVGAVILVMIILRMTPKRAKPEPDQPDDATTAPEDGGEALVAPDGDDPSALPEPEQEPGQPDESGEPPAEQPETEEDDKTETGEA